MRSAFDNPPKPNLSWLQRGAFQKCERMWFYACASDRLPTEAAFEFRAQNRLAPDNIVTGYIADAVISLYLWRIKIGKISLLRDSEGRAQLPIPIPDPSAFNISELVARTAKGFDRLSRDFAAAVRQRSPWPRAAIQPIQSYFYHEPFSDEQWQSIITKSSRYVENFFRSGVLNDIATFPAETWQIQRPLDQNSNTPWFMFEDIPVYAKYDFAIRSPGICLIYDWKTSNPLKSETDAIRQLHWYAIYAHHQWSYPYDQISIAPVFVGETVDYRVSSVDMNLIESIQSDWRSTIVDLRARLSDDGDVLARFPLSKNLLVCRDCKFHSCPGYSRVLGSTGDLG